MATKTRRVIVFNNVSLDGYFVDGKGDMSWAHSQDAEWAEFVSGNAKGDAQLLFGRVTYDMMAAFWPSPDAVKNMPAVANAMNKMEKVVFSRTLDKASWNNTRLVKEGMEKEVRKMKQEAGPDIMIFGSGTVISQLAAEGLIDEYQLVVHPIVLGSGRTMFEGLKKRINMELKSTRAFGNGNVLLCYTIK